VTRIGFIGTGLMGTKMVNCLIDAGHELTVNDVVREAAAEVCGRGAAWAASPREVGEKTDIVFTSLPGPDEVESVFFGESRGVLAGLRPGSCYVDMSTNSPALWRRIAAACSERGIDALDCPVTGRAPDMTIMAGGDAAVLARYRPLLEAMSKAVYHMGEAGMGMVTKGVHQYLLHGKFLLLAEVLLIGTKGGVDLRALTELLSNVNAGRGMPWDTFEKTVFQGAWDRSGGGPGPVDRWVKDVGCAGETARAQDIDMPILEVVEGLLHSAQARGRGEWVNFATVLELEERAGTELRT